MSKKSEKKLFFEAVEYGLRPPLILPSENSKGDVSDKMKENHKLYCLAESAKVFDTKKCPLYDVMIHISCISNIRNLSREEFEIYQYIFAKYEKEGWKKAFGNDSMPTKLSSPAEAVLDEYQRKLFEQQLKMIRERKND
jgi:hypothetical protein